MAFINIQRADDYDYEGHGIASTEYQRERLLNRTATMNTCRVKGDSRIGGKLLLAGLTEHPDGTVTTYAPAGMPPDFVGRLKVEVDIVNRKAAQRARMRAKLAARK